MKNNPFNNNLNLFPQRERSSHKTHFYSPPFLNRGIHKNDDLNPFHRDYLISPEMNKKYVKNKDHKNTYKAKTKREIEMKWEK